MTTGTLVEHGRRCGALTSLLSLPIAISAFASLCATANRTLSLLQLVKALIIAVRVVAFHLSLSAAWAALLSFAGSRHCTIEDGKFFGADAGEVAEL